MPVRATIRWAAGALCAAALGCTAHAQDIEFDVSKFEKKPFEWNGYLELRPEYQRLDRNAALYALQFPGDTRASLERTSSAAEVSGVYRRGELRLHFTGHASYVDDSRG